MQIQPQEQEEYWDDEAGEAAPTTAQVADAQVADAQVADAQVADAQVADLAERRQQLITRLRQQTQSLPSGGRSDGGSFQKSAIAPVTKAAVAEYQVPVQYLPAQHRGIDWIALAVPGMMCFSALVLGGMAIMSSNAPREHDAYVLRTTVDALKIVAERQPTTTINACLAFCGGGNAQPPAPVAQSISQPQFSPQDWLNTFNQQLAQKQQQGIDITPDQTTFQQWVNYWQGQAANGNLQAHADSLQPQECQANIAMCAALGEVLNQFQPQLNPQFQVQPVSGNFSQ